MLKTLFLGSSLICWLEIHLYQLLYVSVRDRLTRLLSFCHCMSADAPSTTSLYLTRTATYCSKIPVLCSFLKKLRQLLDLPHRLLWVHWSFQVYTGDAMSASKISQIQDGMVHFSTFNETVISSRQISPCFISTAASRGRMFLFMSVGCVSVTSFGHSDVLNSTSLPIIADFVFDVKHVHQQIATSRLGRSSEVESCSCLIQWQVNRLVCQWCPCGSAALLAICCISKCSVFTTYWCVQWKHWRRNICRRRIWRHCSLQIPRWCCLMHDVCKLFNWIWRYQSV